jgi:hypothetical protein
MINLLELMAQEERDEVLGLTKDYGSMSIFRTQKRHN